METIQDPATLTVDQRRDAMRSLTRIMEMLANEPKNALVEEWFERAVNQYDDLLAGRYLHLRRRDHSDRSLTYGYGPTGGASTSYNPVPRPERPRLTAKLSEGDVGDLNTVFDFLSSPTCPPPLQGDDHGVVFVLAGNAILPLAYEMFDHVEYLAEEEAVTLVITGGIGHSTSYLYDAIAQEKELRSLAPFEGMSEAELLLEVARKTFDIDAAIGAGKIRVLVDSESTNCGANAIETKRLLDEMGMWPKKLFVVQDPTMYRRTLAGFEKIYAEDERARQLGMPSIQGWTTQPAVELDEDGGIQFETEDAAEYQLWDPARFCSLVLGEIPRLKDDKDGYGPNGTGYIAHVDIPHAVEVAWERLSQRLGPKLLRSAN